MEIKITKEQIHIENHYNCLPNKNPLGKVVDVPEKLYKQWNDNIENYICTQIEMESYYNTKPL